MVRIVIPWTLLGRPQLCQNANTGVYRNLMSELWCDANPRPYVSGIPNVLTSVPQLIAHCDFVLRQDILSDTPAKPDYEIK